MNIPADQLPPLHTVSETLLEHLVGDNSNLPLRGDPLHSVGPSHRRKMFDSDRMWRNEDTPVPTERQWVHISD